MHPILNPKLAIVPMSKFDDLLSQDFRLQDISEYEEWYGQAHRAPDLQVGYSVILTLGGRGWGTKTLNIPILGIIYFFIFHVNEYFITWMQKEAVYGLTEILREEIKSARLVANPGCYPTSIQLPLVPLIKVCVHHSVLSLISLVMVG